MIKFIKNKYSLFITALLQVTCVAMNVVFIANNKIILLLITGFLISFIWSFNVKKIAFGSIVDRTTYATGAMVGTYIGYLLSHQIINLI